MKRKCSKRVNKYQILLKNKKIRFIGAYQIYYCTLCTSNDSKLFFI